MTPPKLTDIKGVGPVSAATLTEYSFTVHTVASATPHRISEILGLGSPAASAIIASAQAIISESPKTQPEEPALAAPETEVAPEETPETGTTPAEKKKSDKSSKGKKDKNKKKDKKSDKKKKSGKKKAKGKKAKKKTTK